MSYLIDGKEYDLDDVAKLTAENAELRAKYEDAYIRNIEVTRLASEGSVRENDLRAKLEAVTSDRDSYDAQINAWYEAFGTTQLSHAVDMLHVAQSRAEHAEKELLGEQEHVRGYVEALNHDAWEKYFNSEGKNPTGWRCLTYNEIHKLKKEKERAEACGAEMREALTLLENDDGCHCEHRRRYPSHSIECIAASRAISTQCGVGLLEKVKRFELALDKLSRLGNEPNFGNSIGNEIAKQAIAETE